MRLADRILVSWAVLIGASLVSFFVCSEFVEIGASQGNGPSTIVVSLEWSSRSLISVLFVVRRSNQDRLLSTIPVAIILLLTAAQLGLYFGAFVAIRIGIKLRRKRTIH